MGFWSNLFKQDKDNKGTKEMHYMEMLNGYTPIFSSFGNDIYASDIVNQAISIIAGEIGKTTPQHIVRQNGNISINKNSNIQKVMKYPNPFMTQSEFLEKVIYLLFKNYNSFIYTQYDDFGNLRGLYPLNPSQVDFKEYQNGTFISFHFDNGMDELTVPTVRIVHLKYHFSENEYMGGDKFGNPDHRGLLFNLNINNNLMQSLEKSINSSYSINGVVKYNSMLNDESVRKDIARLEENLKNSKSGILPLDLKGEYIPINRDVKLIDKDTLEFIDSLILRHYKVSLPILSGDFTKQQYEAFFQICIEPLCKEFSEAFTKTLLTRREIEFGNEIIFYTNKLVFMTMNEQLEAANLLTTVGAATKNEIRAIFGYAPLEDENEGNKIVQSLNYANVNIVDQYQLKENTTQKSDVDKNNKKEGGEEDEQELDN